MHGPFSGSLTYGSVCSGIEAVSVAWAPLGFHPAWFAEIDPFCSALLAYRYPGVPNLGDFTTIQDGHGPIDVLVGGTPCQSFSIAGRRGGLDDARGNLAIEFCRLAGRLRPRWVVWENVPGVLSSGGGRDFGSIVGSLAELGYGCAWRVLDAQFLGVPQRRRRVFVVGHFGDWRRAAAVLLEREGLCRDTPARRKTGEGFTHDLAPSLTGSGRGVERSGESRGQDPVVAVHHSTGDVVGALTSGHTPKGHGGAGVNTQAVAAGHIIPVAFTCKDSGSDAGELSPTLRAMAFDESHANAGGQVAVCFESRVGRNGRGTPSELVPALKAQSGGSGRGDSAPLLAMSGTMAQAVRRLTPRECERLQGMPDDYTLIPYRGKPAPDGPRYRAVGNSMAIPVVRWIGERIQLVDGIHSLNSSA